jgi:tetratricopeptide (TPR) repeat protein
MAALAVENDRLAADAAGVRNLLAAEEKARGKPYTIEERQKRVMELEQALARIGTSTDPLRQEARRLIDAGNVTDGQAKLDAALDADEKGLAEAERMAAERRKAAARSARDLAVLVRGTDVVRAVAYYQRATRLDPSDAETWDDYGQAAFAAGRTAEAKIAFEQAVVKAQDSNNPRIVFWAMLGLGEVAAAQGNLHEALRRYHEAAGIAEPILKSDPGNAGWQRDLMMARGHIGDVLRQKGKFVEALQSYRAIIATIERLAKTEPDKVGWQEDLSVAHGSIGDVLREQGNLAEALQNYRASFAIKERLAKSDPGNAGLQRGLWVSHANIADVLREQGNLHEALQSYRAIITQLSNWPRPILATPAGSATCRSHTAR